MKKIEGTNQEYANIPKLVLMFIYGSDLPVWAIKVALVYWNYRHTKDDELKNFSWPSNQTIINEASINRNYIKAARETLVNTGMMKITRKQQGRIYVKLNLDASTYNQNFIVVKPKSEVPTVSTRPVPTVNTSTSTNSQYTKRMNQENDYKNDSYEFSNENSASANASLISDFSVKEPEQSEGDAVFVVDSKEESHPGGAKETPPHEGFLVSFDELIGKE